MTLPPLLEQDRTETLARLVNDDGLLLRQLLDAFALGRTWKDVFDSIAAPAGVRSFRAMWGVFQEDAALRALVDEAQRAAAIHYAQETMAIADNAADANLAKLQIGARKWLAGVYDSKFNPVPAPALAVNVAVSTLHLDALRNRRLPALADEPAEIIAPAHEPARLESGPVEDAVDAIW